MFYSKLYLTAKKIHRLLVFAAVIFSVTMSFSGAALKYGFLNGLLGADTTGLRYFHNQLSPFLGGILFLMGISGLYMYIFPILNRRG